jgi:anti-sigma factor RsiW
MSECRAPELQDLLPDFVSDSLSEPEHVRLAAHLADCGACRDDVAVLRRVRSARPVALPVDVSAIVARLPKRPARMSEASSRPVLSVHTKPRRLSSPEPTRKSTRRPHGVGMWRIAAGLGVVLAGGMSMLVARRGMLGIATSEAGVPIAVESTTTALALPSAAASMSVESIAIGARASGERADVSVSYGDLGNYSEEELQRILDRLENWDGAPGTEPLPNLPLVPARGGETP